MTTDVHWVPATVVVLYLVALFAVTWWARRLTERSRGGIVGYLLAGRELPFWVGAALLAGLAVGGVSTVGAAEWAYAKGISAGWYNAAWAAAALVVGLGAARRYRRLEITTLPEFFERHYGTTARVLGVIGQLLIQIVITALQYVAGGAILHALMPGVFSLTTGMLVTAAVFVGITLVGGYWAAGLTNVINVAVIYVGITTCALLAVRNIGGLRALADAVPAAHPGFDPLAIGVPVIAAWFLVMITQAHSTQSVIQIGFACADEKGARNCYLLGALLIFPVGFISALIGMAAAALHPGIVAAEALPTLALDTPPIVAGLILSGLWAADVSTASALLMGSATLVSSDIIKRYFAPDLGPERDQMLCKITVAGLSVATFAMALTVQGILKTLLIGLTLATAYTLIVLMTLFCPSLCRRSSATWTLAVTMLTLAGWLTATKLGHTLPHPIYFTWAASLLTFFAVALFDSRRIEVG